MTTVIKIDCFSSGIADLTRKQQGDYIAVLRALQQCGRFSVFEATDNDTIARTMTRLLHKELILKNADGSKTHAGLLVKSTGGTYPWTTCELTDAGKRVLAESAA